MVLDAIRDARLAWPDAEIDLAVGAWNDALARLIPGVLRIQVAQRTVVVSRTLRGVLANARRQGAQPDATIGTISS